MSDYTPITDFGAKNNLASGDPNRLLKGSEWDAEFDAIAAAIASKADGTASVAIEASTATWTPTYGAGFSVDPVGDLRYQIIGDATHAFVLVSASDGGSRQGTANANTFTISAIPAAIRPDATVLSTIAGVINGSTEFAGDVSVTNAGVFTFRLEDSSEIPQTAGWSTSGSKGLPAGWSIMYPFVVTA